MYIETVLFPLHVSQSREALLSVVELCRVENKHLNVLLFADSLLPPLMTLGETGTAEVWAQQMIENERAVKQAASEIEVLLEKSKILFSVNSKVADAHQVDDTVGIHAAYADIVAVQRPRLNDSFKSFANHLYHGTLFSAGKPLLVFDKALPDNFNYKTILIAWDGKRSASRAVVESLPFLKAAPNVHVITIDSAKHLELDSDEVDWELSTYLSRHNVNVTVHAQESMGKNASSIIRNHALEIGANLIVCGSYGRSPLRERIFGGTTGELLEKCSTPLFLTH